MRTTLSLLLATFALVFVPAASGEAAGAPACTIRGTAGNDHLTGTHRRDVICGFGGNDVIYGDAGRDVIRAGAGNDRVFAGAGDDLVLGGPGRDVIWGHGGDDVIRGGPGPDVLKGWDGDDRLEGGSGNDRLTGDEPFYTQGHDVLRGGDGADQLDGGGKADRLFGDRGDDVLAGGYPDRLSGGAGGDDLSGPYGAADGGSGVDYCTGRMKVSVSCGDSEDQRRPYLSHAWLSHRSVDVTNGPRVVTLGALVGDDLGVREVALRLTKDEWTVPYQHYDGLAKQFKGVARRGSWALRVEVPIGVPPGDYTLTVRLTDRADKTRIVPTSQALRVYDRRPDLQPPMLEWLPSPVRDAVFDADSTASFQFRARLTDDRSGVDLVWFCTSRVGSETWGRCWRGRRTSGGTTAGLWVATAHVSDFPGGTYNVDLQVYDQFGRESRWRGPDDWDPESPWPDEHPIPGHRGRFTIER